MFLVGREGGGRWEVFVGQERRGRCICGRKGRRWEVFVGVWERDGGLEIYMYVFVG